MVLLDLGSRAGFVANRAQLYALRPDARNRLNTVFMVSYFLGGYGEHRAGWIGLAAIGAALSLAAVGASGLTYTKRIRLSQTGRHDRGATFEKTPGYAISVIQPPAL
jgi:hypothetical protein